MTELSEIARERGIKYFLISYVDLFGTLRAKLVPAAAIDAHGEVRRRLRRLRHLARHDAGRSGRLRHPRSVEPDPAAVEAEVGWLAADPVDERQAGRARAAERPEAAQGQGDRSRASR